MQQGLFVEFSCKSLLLDSLLRALLKLVYHKCRSSKWLLQHYLLELKVMDLTFFIFFTILFYFSFYFIF